MAKFTQEQKKLIAAKVNPILKKYGVKGTLSVKHKLDWKRDFESSLFLTIRSSRFDFVNEYNKGADRLDSERHAWRASGWVDLTPYCYADVYEEETKEFLRDIFVAMNEGNYLEYLHPTVDATRAQKPKWWTEIHIGGVGTPYVCTATA